MKIQIHPQGTRVRARLGRLPMDPSLVGKLGTVVQLLPGGNRYGVQMDGSEVILVLREDEMEALGPE